MAKYFRGLTHHHSRWLRFYYFILKNKIRRKTARWLTLGIISLGLCLMQFYGSPHYLAYVFESKIKREDPIFILLSQKDTAHFYAYLHKVENSFLDHNSALVPYFTGQYIYSELIRNSPHATPISFYYLAKATVD